MAQYLSPGVYVEETPSAIKPIAGVSTSTAGFIGVVADSLDQFRVLMERHALLGVRQIPHVVGHFQRLLQQPAHAGPTLNHDETSSAWPACCGAWFGITTTGQPS